MKTYIIFLFIILNINMIIAQEFPFNIERLSSDFNGAAFNQKSILIYGTGSIILKSPDRGNSWSQMHIADDSLSILKIKNINENYYGIFNKNFYLKSMDNGLTWFLIPSATNGDLLDMDNNETNIFVLTKTKIIVFDFDFNIKAVVNIDSSNRSKELLVLNERIFMPEDSGKILIFDIKNNYSQSIIDFKSLNICQQCPVPNRIKSDNSNIYIQLSGLLFKSSNEGLNWVQVGDNFNTYNVYNNNIYNMSAGSTPKSYASNILLYSVKDNGQFLITDSSMKRYALYLAPSDYYFLSNDTIIAIGRDKLISFSYDGGHSWELKNTFVNQFHSGTYWVNEKIGFQPNINGQILKTTNGGTVWLPQFFSSQYDNKLTNPDLLYFNENGKGFVYKNGIIYGNNNIMKTDDYGETYKVLFDTSFYFSTLYPVKMFKYNNGYKFIYSNRNFNNIYVRTLTLDSSFNIVNSSDIDSLGMLDIYEDKATGKLYSIAREFKYPNSVYFDSTSYFIMSSTDTGSKWNKEFTILSNDTLFSSLSVYYDIVLLAGIFDGPLDSINGVPYRKGYTNLYNIDLKSKTKLLTIYEDSLSNLSNSIKFNNSIYFGSSDFLYSNDNIKINPYNWQKIPLKNYSPTPIWNNDSVAYFFTTESKTSKAFNLKMTLKKSTGIVETPNIYKTYFWAYPAYPLPAKNKVMSHIYWDTRYDINKSDRSIFNLYGEKIQGKENISLSIYDVWNGLLTWDCNNVPSGIYFIVIKHGDVTKAIPVIVEK